MIFMTFLYEKYCVIEIAGRYMGIGFIFCCEFLRQIFFATHFFVLRRILTQLNEVTSKPNVEPNVEPVKRYRGNT